MVVEDVPRRTGWKAAAVTSLAFVGCWCIVLLFSTGVQPSAPEPEMMMAIGSLQPLKARINKAEMHGASAGLAALRHCPDRLAAKNMVSAVQMAQMFGVQQGCRGNLQCVRAVGLFFGTQGGNTETAAGEIAAATGLEATDVGDISAGDLAGYDGLIVGAPTWHTGADEQRTGTAWDDMFEEIKGMDLCGKPVAVFGVGDSAGYGDNFCDAIEEIHGAFEAAGAKMLGYVPDSAYEYYSESKSVKDGKFLGLPLDQDNEDDQTPDRVKSWVDQIKGEGMPLA